MNEIQFLKLNYLFQSKTDLNGPIWVKDWHMKRLCITNDYARRSHRLSVRPTFLRLMWKNQKGWLENVLETHPNRQIQPKGCTIFAKKKPIHPSEREINNKIKTATKQKLSLLQLLSDGKFIRSQLSCTTFCISLHSMALIILHSTPSELWIRLKTLHSMLSGF